MRTITIYTDVEIDLKDALSEADTEDLLQELKDRRNLSEVRKLEDNLSIDYDMKMKVIEENLHKFSWIEICEIFENKK